MSEAAIHQASRNEALALLCDLAREVARWAEEPAVGVLAAALEEVGHVVGETIAAALGSRAIVPDEVPVAHGPSDVRAVDVGVHPAEVVPAALWRTGELAGRTPRRAGQLAVRRVLLRILNLVPSD